MRSVNPSPEPTAGPALDNKIQRRSAVHPVSGYKSLGCYHDSEDPNRFLNGTLTYPITNAPQYCCDWCVNVNTAYTICGVENGAQCFCDSTASNSNSAAASNCNSPCPGSDEYMCGGSWFLNLYSATVSITADKSSKTLTAQQVSSFADHGCYADNNRRVLRGSSTAALLNNPEYCCDWCANVDNNNVWCGVEYGTECHCDTTTHSPIPASASACSSPCPGGGGYQCGAFYHINLYELTGVRSTIAPATESPTSSETNSASQSDSSLGGGAIAGIAIGGVAVLAALGAVVFLLMRRRRRSQTPPQPPVLPPIQDSKPPPFEVAVADRAHELQAPLIESRVMPEHERRIYEMDSRP